MTGLAWDPEQSDSQDPADRLRKHLDTLDQLGEIIQQAGATMRATVALLGAEADRVDAELQAERRSRLGLSGGYTYTRSPEGLDRSPANRPPENRPPDIRPPENRPPENQPPENQPPEMRPPENRPPETLLPDWLQPALIRSGSLEGWLSDLTGSLPTPGARLVTLTPPNSAAALRSLLPRGLAVQPDDSIADAPVVLVYRHEGDPPDQDALRDYYRLVDLIALLSPSGRLDPDLHARVESLLPQLPLAQDSLAEHISARAKWRRTVAAGTADFDEPLLAMTAAARIQLTYLLIQVSGQDPRTGLQLPALLRRFRLPFPSELSVDNGVAQLLGDLLGTSTGRVAAPSGSRTRSAFQPVLHPVLQAQSASAPAGVPVPRSGENQDPEPPATDPEPDDDSTNLTGAVLAFAHLLAQQDHHALSGIQETADLFGLAPLQAIQTINEWALHRPLRPAGIPSCLIQVDEQTDAVRVESQLRQLLI